MPHSVFKFLLLLLVTALAACGGGGSSSNGGGGVAAAGATIYGTAAVGAPIVGGTVSVVCAAGSAPAPVQTAADGAWTVTVSGQTLPCKVKVTGGTINGGANLLTYYSAALNTGVVNVTPLTDLMIANLVGTSPATWFGNALPASFSLINQSGLTGALTQLRNALPVMSALGGLNPITQVFSAVLGNAMDDMLAALQTTMLASNLAYADLLLNFTFAIVVPPSEFNTALVYVLQHPTISAAAAPAVDAGQCLTPLNGVGINCFPNAVHDWIATTHNGLANTSCRVTIAAGVISLTQGAATVTASMAGDQNDQMLFSNSVIAAISANDGSGTNSSTVNLVFVNGVLAQASGSNASSSLTCSNI